MVKTKLAAAIEAIKDKDVKAAFTDGSVSSVDFVRDREKEFRALFKGDYEAFRDNFERRYRRYCSCRPYMKLCLGIELGVFDCRDLNTAVDVCAEGIVCSPIASDRYSFDLTSDYYKKGLGNGYTAEMLMSFLGEHPECLHIFLPVMTESGDERLYSYVVNLVKSAAIEDGIRIQALYCMLTTDSKVALKFFLGEIEKNRFYALSAMNDVMQVLSDWTATLRGKDAVRVMSDALNRKFDEYTEYATAVTSGAKSQAVYGVFQTFESREVSETFADVLFLSSRPLDFEELSFICYDIDPSKMTTPVLQAAYSKLLGAMREMKTVSVHFKSTQDIPFSRDLSKAMLIGRLAKIALKLGKEYVATLDGEYGSLKEEAQAKYLKEIGTATSLDRRACAVRFLKTDNYDASSFYDDMKITLSYDEAVAAAEYLKSKKESVKRKLVKEFLRSDSAEKIAEFLLNSDKDYMRAAGSEMRQSFGKLSKEKMNQSESYFSFAKPSLFEPEPPLDEMKRIAASEFPFKPETTPISRKKLDALLEAVAAVIDKNKDFEYRSAYGVYVLGTHFSYLDGTKGDKFADYPEGEELKKIIADTLDACELTRLAVLMDCRIADAKEQYAAMCGKAAANELFELLDCRTSFSYSVLVRLYSPIVKDLMSPEQIKRAFAAFADNKTVKVKGDAPTYTLKKGLCNLGDDESIGLFLQYLCRKDLGGLKPSGMDSEAARRFLESGSASPELIEYLILRDSYINWPLYKSQPSYIMRRDYEHPEYRDFILGFMQKALDTEFKRGSLETPYSSAVCHFPVVFGADNYFRAIVALRGLTWVRSPYGTEKNAVFSSVLKKVKAADGDDFETFLGGVKKYEITRSELLRATLFNPEFVDYTGRVLGIEHLKLAVYWFIAHLSEELYGDEKEARAEKLKQFSEIDYGDFLSGAFDCKWYEEMIEKVSEKDLEDIYDNAKFVTVGGLHKRAQRFFDAVGGRLSKQECIEKINASRNKDFCLAYSLIPVEGRQDIKERYAVFSRFLRESRKFGAQRQLSERRTADIAIENLARAAGYPDADIFVFEIEADDSDEKFALVETGDTTVEPYIDKVGLKALYRVTSKGKTLSAIPKRLAKDEGVLRLKENVKQLNEKFSRVKRSFEKAMCERTVFTAKQLSSLGRDRVLSAVMSSLLFLSSDGKLAKYSDGGLKDFDGFAISGDAVIAHPVELRRLGLLGKAMEYVISGNIKQPFKQALREIYTIADEEKDSDEMIRFKGFNVDLGKCIAALKGRGWGVSEDIGLRKVYHRRDLIAAIFRKFDCWFSADSFGEHRELSSVLFLNRKTEDVVRLKDVDELTFSETLRDVDLMITVSANNVYNYELAKFTVELRREVLKTIVRMLGLDNVTFLKENISVKGGFGTYTVNIRTGLVAKEGKGSLLLATVYDTEKPILLDFVDEDPMSVDVISKVLLLASDTTVRDPAVLSEIKD